MKATFRSTFAALLAALAFACVGLGDRIGADRLHGPTLQRPTGTRIVTGGEALALAFLQGGTPVLAGVHHRTGALPRVAPGTHPTDPSPADAAQASRMAAAGVRIRPALRPPFARDLAAARDGTLSARSNGVPPPALA